MVTRGAPFVLAFVLLFASISTSAAQGLSPSSTPDVPSAGECWVPPVSVLSVLSMLNTVDQAGWDPSNSLLYTREFTELIRGETLTDEDMRGIEFTNRMLIACGNAVSPLQIMALLEEGFQARMVYDVANSNDLDSLLKYLPMFATQTAETEGIPSLTVVDAWYAPDTNKRIQAVVEPFVADAGTQPQFLVEYVYSVDRWLISGVWLMEK